MFWLLLYEINVKYIYYTLQYFSLNSKQFLTGRYTMAGIPWPALGSTGPLGPFCSCLSRQRKKGRGKKYIKQTIAIQISQSESVEQIRLRISKVILTRLLVTLFDAGWTCMIQSLSKVRDEVDHSMRCLSTRFPVCGTLFWKNFGCFMYGCLFQTFSAVAVATDRQWSCGPVPAATNA